VTLTSSGFYLTVPLSLLQTIHQGRRTSIITDLPCCDKEADRSSAGVSDRVQFGIHASLFQPQAGGRTMCFEVGGVD